MAALVHLGNYAMIVVRDGGLLVGRGPTCDLRLDEMGVSREHVRFSPTPQGLQAKDLDSRNGMLVNGKRARQAVLQAGDRVQIGEAHLLVVEEGRAAPLQATASRTQAVAYLEFQAEADLVLGEGALSAQRLGELYRVGNLLAATQAPQELASAIVQVAAESLDARWAGLCTTPPGDEPYRILLGTGPPDASPSLTHLERVMSKGCALLSCETREGTPSMHRQNVSSVLAVPLLRDGRPEAVLYLDRAGSAPAFTEGDLQFARAIALQASAILHLLHRIQSGRESTPDPLNEMIGESEALLKLQQSIQRVASSPASILIVGETGTGKELVARALHAQSTRCDGPFVAVNCGALPAQLVESELFGHVKGAYTGAAGDRLGRIREAAGGTLFLDEIGDLPEAAQVSLLRALEQREVRPVGGTQEIAVDFRLIAATHKKLTEEVQAGRFRQDLFYRLNVVTLNVPGLAERRSDIPLLARHYLRELRGACHRPEMVISESALRALEKAPWPGNIRQLRNTIERAILMAPGPELRAQDLDLADLGRSLLPPGGKLREVEIACIREALLECGGNKQRTAQRLGIARSTLYEKLAEYEID